MKRCRYCPIFSNNIISYFANPQSIIVHTVFYKISSTYTSLQIKYASLHSAMSKSKILQKFQTICTKYKHKLTEFEKHH